MQKKVLLVSTLVLGLAASSAFANGAMPPAPCPVNAFTPGIIVGLQAGFVDTGWDNISGDRGIVSVDDDTGFGGRIYLGYDAYDWLGFELGYLHFFSKTDISVNNDGQSTEVSDIKTDAIDLVGKLKSPTYEGLGLYAKAGVAYMMSTDRNEGDFDNGLDDSVKKFGPVYGVGLNYALPSMPNLSLDLSWTRYDSGHEGIDNEYLPNLDFYALGIAYKFNM